MRESVRLSFIQFSAPFEGRLPYMYLDILGLVTTGVGNLIDSVAVARTLPWQVGDGGPAATPERVRAEWELVKSRQDLRNTPAERAFRPITTLRLSDAAIDAMIMSKLTANEASLRNTTEFAGLDTWPADAQLALLSMAWAMGPAFAADGRWPSFRAAIAAGDWVAAAANCEINATGNPGVVPRNDANRQLFLNARRVVDEGLDPDVLLYGQASAAQPTGRAMFSVGGYCIPFDVATNSAGTPIPLTDHWKGIDSTHFAAGVRAVVGIGAARYAFSGPEYVRLHGQVADDGYPLPIAAYWPGFAETGFAEDLYAAVDLGTGKLYFFRGAEYIRYDVASNRVDAGYPRPIAGNWSGLAEAGFADGVDAAVRWPTGKAYFFRGEYYLRYDIATDRVDDGYPLPIAGFWPGLAEAGMGGPIDAVWME